MAFIDDLNRELIPAESVTAESKDACERFTAEVRFAAALAEANPKNRAAWRKLVLRAVAAFRDAAAKKAGVERALADAERILAPVGPAAKRYTIHCVGHAHIDMNWMWPWPETVATVNDTFTTVDRLMDEFPTLHFSQSQISVYEIARDYLPELYERIRRRVREGRWEITASQWVEGDKNLASGESLHRHLLHAKRWLRREFGLAFDAIKIDWECDTFGHAHTLPTILNTGGVRRYYFHRTGPGPRLFWWKGPDGSRVLAFDDGPRGYNGRIGPDVARGLLEFEKATGLRDFLFVYGVGDHGGGPTRRDLACAVEMDRWPVFPNIRLSTTDAFFFIAEREAKGLPVIDAELNFIFEGCYTSQSNIKRANRRSENALVEAEACALVGRGAAGLDYPDELLYSAWRDAMFNQFHDILPGSGMHATYEHAQGLFQEILAKTSMIKTRNLRAIAAMVNTEACCPCGEVGNGVGPGIGGGPGDIRADGELSRLCAGSGSCDPFVIFNPSPWSRSDVVVARLWDREYPADQIAVTDESGKSVRAQFVEKGNYWGHTFIDVAFPAADVPALGYRSFSVARMPAPQASGPCTGDGKGVIENEFLRVEVEQGSGAIVRLLDKSTGVDFVRPGSRIGVLEYMLEAPHGMTAWCFGQIVKTVPLVEGATLECSQNGPFVASVRARRKFNESSFTTTIALAAGVPRVDFTLEADWFERGTRESGVPMLKVAFALAADGKVATFECANGHVARPCDTREVRSYTRDLAGFYWPHNMPMDPAPGEVPMQRWMDLSGKVPGSARSAGVTLVNDCKYGCSIADNVVRLTLLRSSSDPDPAPEMGHHVIRWALRPHVGRWSASDATREGAGFNLPFNVVGTTRQQGRLPASKSFAEILTPGVMLSALKKAEDSDAVVVRLYEMEGRATAARLRLDKAICPASACAVETDTLEQPLPRSSARMRGGVLSVRVPAFGVVTVKIG